MAKEIAEIVPTLQFAVEKLDYSNIKATEDSQGSVKSGAIMFADLNRTNFVINGKKIDQHYTQILHEKVRDLHHESKEKDYRPYLVTSFKAMFEHAKATVPSEPIIQELITNCNQAGYFAAVHMNLSPGLHDLYKFLLRTHTKSAMHINCNDPNCVDLKLNMEFPIASEQDPGGTIAFVSSSLEFKLSCQNGKDVEYTDGKLSLKLREAGFFSELIKNLLDLFEKAFGIKIGREHVKVIFDKPNGSVTEAKVDEHTPEVSH